EVGAGLPCAKAWGRPPLQPRAGPVACAAGGTMSPLSRALLCLVLFALGACRSTPPASDEKDGSWYKTHPAELRPAVAACERHAGQRAVAVSGGVVWHAADELAFSSTNVTEVKSTPTPPLFGGPVSAPATAPQSAPAAP